jgi:SH3-like domain-containing protein
VRVRTGHEAESTDGRAVGRPIKTLCMALSGLGILSIGLAACLAATTPGRAQGIEKGPVSGLPLPRFVSLKSDEVNLRAGPGREYPTQWVFRRAGLPVEIIKEFEGWRQVRDAEGVTGWVSQALLSGRRTALVLPWELKPDAPAPQVVLRDNDSESADARAMVEAGVIASIHSCDSRWCEVTIDAFRGYVEQSKLWGIYQGEVIK